MNNENQDCFVVEGSPSQPVISQDTFNETIDVGGFIDVEETESVSQPSVVNQVFDNSNQCTYCVKFRFADDELFSHVQPRVFPSVTSQGLCSVCLRQSTASYPLNLRTISLGPLYCKRQFGNKISPCFFRQHLSIDVCNLCECYLRESIWKFAWPAVLCSFTVPSGEYQCNGQYFYSLLPEEFHESWSMVASQLGYVNPSGPTLFQDFTIKFKN